MKIVNVEATAILREKMMTLIIMIAMIMKASNEVRKLIAMGLADDLLFFVSALYSICAFHPQLPALSRPVK